MAVDPQGENSKDFENQALTAAGGNSSAARRARVKSQLRDKYGRWVEMGRDAKIKIRFMGKIIDVIGRFVGGSDKEGYGRFVVKNDPNDVPDGVYHFKGAALNSILASLDPKYLKRQGIQLNRDVNGNLVGDVLDEDIEDLKDIRREEIGELDNALATGKLSNVEKAQEATSRKAAKAYISKNVVATLEEASKDDVAEGAEAVRKLLNVPSSESDLPEGAKVDKRYELESAKYLLKPFDKDGSIAKLIDDNAPLDDIWDAIKASDLYKESSDLVSDIRGKDFLEPEEHLANKRLGKAKEIMFNLARSRGKRYFESKQDREIKAKARLAEEKSSSGIEQQPVRRRESWYVSPDGKNYTEQNVPAELKTPENRRTWNPNTNEVVDGNGEVIPFEPTYDDKFNPVPTAEDAPQYATLGNPFWDAKEMDANGTRSVHSDELITPDVDAAYENLYNGGYLIVSKDTAVGVLLKASEEAEAKKAADKLKASEPKASQEILDQIRTELDEIQPINRTRILSAIDLKKLSASDAQNMLDSLSGRRFKDSSGILTGKERADLIKTHRNLPIDMTNMQVVGDKGITQNGLGVARSDMPAVKSADHDVFEQRLKELGIGFTFEEMPASKMIQIQREMSADNVGGMLKSILDGKFKPWETKAGKPNPIYVAQNGEILDGHHRWAAAKAAGWKTGEDPNIPVVRIDLPYEQALTLMNEWGNFHGIESQTLDKNRKGNLAEFFEVPKEQHLQSIFDEIESAGFPDMEGLRNGGSANESTRRLRDHILRASELIEQHQNSPTFTREQLYNNLMQASVEHAKNLADGVAYTPDDFVGKADTVQKITARKEGGTMDALTLSQPRKGIAVAVEGTNEEIIDSFFYADGVGELFIADYIDRNLDALSGDFKLGTWHDKDNNEITLDVIELFAEPNREEAISAGQNRNQQGIFKISNKEYIETGGTGDRGRTRREREEARGEGGQRPVSEQRAVESPQSSRKGVDAILPEEADDSRDPELRAIPSRKLIKHGKTDSEAFDNVEITGDRVTDAINLINAGKADIISDLLDEKKKDEYLQRFESILKKLQSGDDKEASDAIEDLRVTALSALNDIYAQPEFWKDVWGDDAHSVGTEVSRDLYSFALTNSKQYKPSELMAGIDAFMPDLEKITRSIAPGKELDEIEEILGDLKEKVQSKNYTNQTADSAYQQLKKLGNKLQSMIMEAYHSADESDFANDEWFGLQPIKNRIIKFLDASMNHWNQKGLPVLTFAPEVKDKGMFNSRVLDELFPEIEVVIDVKSGEVTADVDLKFNKDALWIKNLNDNLKAGGDVVGALVQGIEALTSDDKDERRTKLANSIQRIINSSKKFRQAYRPSPDGQNEMYNSSNSSAIDLPEMPGSNENPDREPTNASDYIVDGTSEPEPTLAEVNHRIGTERAAALQLSTRNIDRSKMSDRQKAVLKVMVTNRTKALKVLKNAVENGTLEDYNRAYNYALATTNAIKRLVGGVESQGADFKFGSKLEERLENILVIKESIKRDEFGSNPKKVLKLEGFYTAKNGKTYFAEWDGYIVNIKNIGPDGKPGQTASYVKINFRSEDTRGAEYPASATPGYLKTYPRFQQQGLGAASITFARIVTTLSGEHFSHSGALTAMGANNSKGIDSNDPDLHHKSQAEKVLQLMGAPAIKLMQRAGWFNDTDEHFSMDGVRSNHFLADLNPTVRASHGAADFTGPLHTLDARLQNTLGEEVRQTARDRGVAVKDLVAGQDYPEFFDYTVQKIADTGRSGYIEEWSVRKLLTEMSYKDGISYKDGLERLQKIQSEFEEFFYSKYPEARADENAFTERMKSNPDYMTRVTYLGYANANKYLKQLTSSLIQYPDWDADKIDRPKVMEEKDIKFVTKSPYGEDASTPIKFDFGGYKRGTLVAEDLKNYKDIVKFIRPADYILRQQYERDYPNEEIPERWTTTPEVLANRFSTEDLKEAIRVAVQGDPIKNPDGDIRNSGWGVELNFGRDYATTPSFGKVRLQDAMAALNMQGEDSDRFLAEILDTGVVTGDKSVVSQLDDAKIPRVSLIKEIDNVIKKAGIKKANIRNFDAPKKPALSNNGTYDSANKVAIDNSKRVFTQVGMFSYAPGPDVASLIDNERFDFSDGREDVLGAPPVDVSNALSLMRLNENGTFMGTEHPMYIARNFKKESLVEAFKDALIEERDYVNLQFGSENPPIRIPLTSIRDALQRQNVDTNELAKKYIASGDKKRAEEDAQLMPNGRIAYRNADEIVSQATRVMDVANLRFVRGGFGGVNSPELYEDPDTGKQYMVKMLDARGAKEWEKRAVDQEIATQAFYRALGINASQPFKGIDSTRPSLSFVLTEFIETGNVRYEDELFELNGESRIREAMRDNILADLFIDQIDGCFNTGNVLIDTNGNPIRIDGGGGLLWDPMPEHGSKDKTGRFDSSVGSFQGNVDADMRDRRRAIIGNGTFNGDTGIEFGFDYYLNPDGWHWRSGQARRNILRGITEENLKEQAKRFFLDNMTPDRIDAISRTISDAEDRAHVAETLNLRRSRILERFGIEDTYDRDAADLTSRIPSKQQVNDLYDLVMELEDIKGFEVFSKDIDDVLNSRNATAGQASQLISDLQSFREVNKNNVPSAEELAKQAKEKQDAALEQAEADADFAGDAPQPAQESELKQREVKPKVTKVKDLQPGDYVLDENLNGIGRVLFKSNTADGKHYIGLIDDNKNYVEKTYDYKDKVSVDYGTRRDVVNPQESAIRPDQDLDFQRKFNDRANRVLADVKSTFVGVKEMPNGDLVVASTVKTEPTRLKRTFKYDVVVHRKPNEKFVAYVRQTQIDGDGNPIGETRVGRISTETHSSRHLINRIRPLLGGGRHKGILADFPQNWFNNSGDLDVEVTHPSTGQPIPRKLAPDNLNQKYIGNTGIEVTGDPVRDALIGYVADMIDRGVKPIDVASRLNKQTVLTKSQVNDLIERIATNRAYPGVNKVPYVSRDNVNIVRQGDRIRHYSPDGTIREGYVVSREPLMVYQKSPGDYGYTDVLRVRFDNGTRSAIVAKNLEILRRADGSTPEIRLDEEAARRRAQVLPYQEPDGLMDGYIVKDTETIRRYTHTDSENHVRGTVKRIKLRDGSFVYYARVYDNNQASGAGLPVASLARVTDKNFAQAWVIATINAKEEERKNQKLDDSFASLIRSDESGSGEIQTGRNRNSDELPERSEDGKEKESEIVGTFAPEDAANPEETIEDVPTVDFSSGEITTSVAGKLHEIMESESLKSANKKGKRIYVLKDYVKPDGTKLDPSDPNQPKVVYSSKADKNGNVENGFTFYPRLGDTKGGIFVPFSGNQKTSETAQIDLARKLLSDAVNYEDSGPHYIFSGGDSVQIGPYLISNFKVDYADYLEIWATRNRSDYLVTKLDFSPKSATFSEKGQQKLKDMVLGAVPRGIKSVPKDKTPQVVQLGGGPAAGKSTALKAMQKLKSSGGTGRKDNPDGYSPPHVGTVQTFLENGVKVEPSDISDLWAVIDPDAFKLLDERAADSFLRQMLRRYGIISRGAGEITDRKWASEVHPISSLAKKLTMQLAIQQRWNTLLDVVGNDSAEKVKKSLAPFVAAGYETTLVYVDQKPEIAVGRAAGRVKATFRGVPLEHQAANYVDLAEMHAGDDPNNLVHKVADNFYLVRATQKKDEKSPYVIAVRKKGESELSINTNHNYEEEEDGINGQDYIADLTALAKKASDEIERDNEIKRIISSPEAEKETKKAESQNDSYIEEATRRDESGEFIPPENYPLGASNQKIIEKLRSLSNMTGLSIQKLSQTPGIMRKLATGVPLKQIQQWIASRPVY